MSAAEMGMLFGMLVGGICGGAIGWVLAMERQRPRTVLARTIIAQLEGLKAHYARHGHTSAALGVWASIRMIRMVSGNRGNQR